MKSKWIVLLLLCFAVGPAMAEDVNESAEKQNLEDLVVTGTRTQERAIDVPVVTEVITSEQIKMSGATHIGDLISKYITGHYHKYNGLLSPVGLRGFRTETHGDDVKGYVLLLVDGHRVGTGNAAKINIDRIEKVEITKGPASALYGSAAMGGVINLITKKGDGEAQTTLSGDYGSFDYYKGQVESSAEVNDNFQFHLTASYEDTDDFDDPEFGTVYNTAETHKNIGGNFVYRFNDRHMVRLGGNYADLTGESSQWTNGAYSTYSLENNQHFDKSHGYADLEYNGIYLNQKLNWKSLFYYLWDRNHWYHGPDGDADADQSRYTDKTLGTDQQFTYPMTSWNKIVLGFTYEQMEKEASGMADHQPSAPYTPGLEYNSQAVYLQNALDLWQNRINILAAARYDKFDVSTRQAENALIQDFQKREESYDHISPKLGASIKFFDELLRLRANVGEGFKSPSADQLSTHHTSYGVTYVGNPDLDPETSLTYDLGFDINLDFLTLNASYFHSDYTDKIVQVIDGNTGFTTYANHGEAEITGFDINLEWKIGRTFDWNSELNLWANTTINTTYRDEEANEDLTFISDYEVKSGLDFSNGAFSSQLTYTLIGPQKVTNYDMYPYVNEDKDSFSFCDLTMRYKISSHWAVRASILNLFDDRVEWVRGYLQAERNYRIGLSYSF